jgi:hypothetical protein
MRIHAVVVAVVSEETRERERRRKEGTREIV